jgi:cytochrome bd-type quinol oxidase subunit 1
MKQRTRRWLTILEALHPATGRPAYRQAFEFWFKIFGVAFGLGIVSGITGANLKLKARRSIALSP